MKLDGEKIAFGLIILPSPSSFFFSFFFFPLPFFLHYAQLRKKCLFFWLGVQKLFLDKFLDSFSLSFFRPKIKIIVALKSAERILRSVLPLNTCGSSIIGNPVVLITCIGASLALAIDADVQGDDDLSCQKSPLRSAVHRRKMAIMISVEDGGNDAPEYSGTKIHS